MLFLLALALVAGCSHDSEIKPPAPSRDATSSRAQQAQTALDGLVRALRGGSRHSAERLAAAPARDLLGEVHDNAGRLHLDHLSMRYVDEGPQPDSDQSAQLGDDAWVGTVDLTYAYAGFDTTPAEVETQVVFVPRDGRALIGGFGGDRVRTPLWLTDRLSVVRSARTLVLVAGDGTGRYPALATRAVAQVHAVLPRWDGPLVVEVPDSEDQLETVVHADPGEYRNIAAVTTTADGSLAAGAPVRVFVNPGVLGRLKERGAQVVMSHETTHAAVGAPFSAMPTWLLEGFADYVALLHADVPVSLAAGQILRRIRADGLPKGLPTARDLDPTANGLGATYEEAWLACRYLGERYGTTRMVAFYRAVDGGATTREAFRSVLGTTQDAFVAGWRRDLSRLAGVTG